MVDVKTDCKHLPRVGLASRKGSQERSWRNTVKLVTGPGHRPHSHPVACNSL